MNRNRIALLGAGRMARVHAQTIARSGFHLVSVYDVSRDAATDLADEHAAAVASTPNEAFEREDVDAVIIATPSDTHVDYVLGAVTAGKAVLCEKPLAPSLAEAQRCVDGLGDAAPRVFLAFNRRFDPGHGGVYDAISAGEIDAVEQLTITARDPAPPPLSYIPSSGGLFRDMMIHDFDMARWLLGEEPVRLYAEGASLVDPEIGRLGDIDTATVTLATASGRQAVIINSRRAAYGYDQRVEAFGSKGMLISDNLPRTGLRRFTPEQPGTPEPFRAFFMERYGESYTRELQAFLDCVARDAPMPVTAVDGLRAAYLAEAATDSLARGTPIDLDPTGAVTWQ